MNPHHLLRESLLLLSLSLALGIAAPPALAADDESDLPDSLRSGYVSPITGPRNSERYANGELGLVLPGYGRASLYVAWRAMQLPPRALASESHAREGNWVTGPQAGRPRGSVDEIHAWTDLRQRVTRDEPAVRPDYFRTGTRKLERPDGAMYNVSTTEPTCGPDAFAFATRTLQGLLDDPKVSDPSRQRWVANQDAVFAQCTWSERQGPAPALPVAPPDAEPARLRALWAYQHAAARFYSEDFEGARQEFDAIASRADHPMRAWAALAALRSVVRSVAIDPAWDGAVTDAIWVRHLRDDALQAALAQPRARHRALVDAAVPEIDKRANAIL